MNVSSSSTSLASPLIELRDLFQIVQRQDELSWTAFREGVDIHRLYGDGITGPTAALLRFNEAAEIPMHVHEGYEHILVLAGSQRDESGVLETGTLRIHAPGTTHRVTGEAGCIVLAIYEKPVSFI
ncbi:MAG: hypothetical protein JWO89_1000 [Verrucomicrobiaceae bacterium]|nr:hypothetical protein [Verrucomicrobiaceae bacterium]